MNILSSFKTNLGGQNLGVLRGFFCGFWGGFFARSSSSRFLSGLFARFGFFVRELFLATGVALASVVLLLGGLAQASHHEKGGHIKGTMASKGANFAYINIQKVVQSSKQGKKAKAILEKDFKKFEQKKKKAEAEVKKLQDEAQKMMTDLEKKRPILSPEALGDKQKSIQEKIQQVQRKVAEFQQMAAKSQQDMQAKERKLIAPIQKKITQIVEQLAKQKSYDMVFERGDGFVVWARAELDLTDQVLKLVDK